MKKITKIFSTLLIATMALTACSVEGEDKSDDNSNTTTAKENSEITIGVSLSTLNNPFFVDIQKGIEEVANEENVKVVISDAQNDSAKQSNQMDDLIQQNVDLLIVNPVDSQAISPSVENANGADIPVIAVDRGADSGQIVSLVASDNVEGGRMAGEFIMEKLGENAKVAQLEGIPGASSTRERGEGFKEATDGKIDFVATQTANFDRSEAMSVMENMIQANPDIQAVFSQNDEMALGAIEALSSNSDILVVGFDGTEDAIKAVKDGKLAATVAQKPEEMGKLAVKTAIKYLNGEKVEENISSPLELITE
ncbi:MAG: D-ribose ABC transporter substrate-binding protein [Tissierellia bacterium]|nr:D-ribose ABC transporter substrate-binding protein [Tissierellia bacterium]